MVYMVYMVYDGTNTLRRMHADCIRVPLMTSLRDGGGDGGGGADGGGGDRGCEGGGVEAVWVAETADAATVTVLADIGGL